MDDFICSPVSAIEKAERYVPGTLLPTANQKPQNNYLMKKKQQ